MLGGRSVADDAGAEDPRTGFRLMLAVSRLYAINPVGPAPAFEPMVLLRVYNLGVTLYTAYYEIFFCGLTALAIAPGNPFLVLTVLVSLCFAAMTVSSLAFLVGSFRKAALLPGLLAHPLTAAPRCQPRTAAIVAQLGVLVVGYCVLGAGFLLSSPEMDPAVKKVSTASCVLFAMSAVEKLSMNHMVRRVGRRFAAINDDLGEAHSVVAARSGMHAERRGPQVTQRVAEARAQHKECCCMLAALTRCFEAQLVGILVMDFFVLLASVFLAILLLMHDATIPSLLVASSTNGSFCITGTFLLARTCHLAGREARRAHTSVHAVLNLPHVGPEEVRELKAFSFQLLHAKTSVTPFQMFTVDYSLISTLSVGFFTYSIMVGQFGLVGSKNLEGYYGNGTDAPNTTAMLDFATSGDR